MSISQSIRNLFDFERKKGIRKELLGINSDIQVVYFALLILSKMGNEQTIKKLMDKDEALQLINNITERHNFEIIPKIRKSLGKLAYESSYSAKSALENRLKFHKFILSLNISGNITKYSEEQSDNINSLIKILESLVTSKNLPPSITIEHLKLLIQNLSGQNYLQNLDDKNTIHNFIKIYYEKLSSGSSVTLLDIADIINDLAKSEISDKIILRIVSR